MNNINYTGEIIALLSFVIGTTLLSLYLYFGESFIPLKLGIGFVLMAIVVNIIIFTVVLGSAILTKQHRSDAIKTCGIMLLNIPIAIVYFFIIISF